MTADSHLVCRRCGFANVPGDTFCGSCGAFLEWEGEAAVQPDPPAVDTTPDVPIVRAAGGQPPVVVPVRSSVDETAATQVTQTGAGTADGGLLRCPACGIANAAGRTFCQSCGTKLAEAPRVAEVTAAQIAAAVNTPARPVTVQSTTVRPASEEPRSGGGSIAKWIVLMVVVGVLVGAGAVVVSQLLKGSGPASVASSGPSAPATGAPSGAASGVAPSGGAPSGETPSGEATAAPAKPVALALTDPKASSVVGDLDKFAASRAIDGNPKTCWQEGSATEKGQWIEVSFAPSTVTSLVLTNGYNASKGLYKGNKRLKDIAVSIDGGAPVKLRMDDTGSPQKLNVEDVPGATTLRITIVSTYASAKTAVPGTPFDDAALGEIVVMGVPGS